MTHQEFKELSKLQVSTLKSGTTHTVIILKMKPQIVDVLM